jgi:hypothetical protein
MTIVLDAHPGPVGVCQAQDRAAQPVQLAVDEVVPLASRLVHAVRIDRGDRVLLVHGQIARPAVQLPRAREDDLDVWVFAPAGLEDGELATAVDVQVSEGVIERVDVARLTGEVEEHLLTPDQAAEAVHVADIGDVHAHPALDPGDVGGVAAVLGDQRVDEHDLRAEPREAVREVRADEAEAAGDEHPAPAIEIEHVSRNHQLDTLAPPSDVPDAERRSGCGAEPIVEPERDE